MEKKIKICYLKNRDREKFVSDISLEESEIDILSDGSCLKILEGRDIPFCLKFLREYPTDYLYIDFGIFDIRPFLFREENNLDYAIVARVNIITLNISHLILASPLIREGDIFLVGSKKIKADLGRLISGDNIFVLPYGFNLKEIGAHKRHANKDNHKIIYVGRLSPEKGVHNLIKSMVFLKNTGYNLSVIGPMSGNFLNGKECKYYKFLKYLAKKLNINENVTFKGALGGADKFKEIFSSKFLINPSIANETFGRVNIEALICGTPVICTNNNTFREILGPMYKLNGKDIIENLFTNPTPESIASSIKYLTDKEIWIDEKQLQQFEIKSISKQLNEILCRKKELVNTIKHNKFEELRYKKIVEIEEIRKDIVHLLKEQNITYGVAIKNVMNNKPLLDLNKLEEISKFFCQVKLKYLYF